MTETQTMLAAAALLIAAVMLPIPSALRGILFVILVGFALLSGVGAGLSHFSGWFN